MSVRSSSFISRRSSSSPPPPSNADGAQETPLSPSSTRPVPTRRSITQTNTLSTSLGQRNPARSFASASHGYQALDTSVYSSSAVRDQTQELSSWGFGESTATRLTRRPSAESSTSPTDKRRKGRGDGSGDRQRRDSQTSALPNLIEEPSEPASPVPGSSSITPPSKSSALTNMLHDSRRQTDEVKQDRGPQKPPHAPRMKSLPGVIVERAEDADEETPLLTKSTAVDTPLKAGIASTDVEGQPIRPPKQTQLRRLIGEAQGRVRHVFSVTTSPKRWSGKAIWEKGVKQPIGFLPCVFLGLLLNVLDALSYGMILFPLGEPVFEKTGPDGISMFYVSCIVSQLVYTCGGSIFKGAVGSEMIEVVPFFHKMAYSIIARVGTSNPKVVLATVITSYAMSSIITGLVFFLLGAFKLGSLVSFFPRHILIGCIGGVGFFLFVTGIEVSARLDGNLEYNIPTAKKLFSAETAPLWTIPLVLSIALLVFKRFKDAPWVVPAFFIGVAAIFYIVATAVSSITLPNLRDQGWIFEEVDAELPWYNFYSYYDFEAVDWKAVAATIPSMFALTFFGVLHVPINVPALAIAAGEDDLNLNRELVAHGVSNALSGFMGSIQNYLVYVNSEMFMSNGGNHRMAGLLLAAATFGVLVAGPAMIGYVPIMVVGALIFYLGIALLEEALFDTWGKMTKLEYFTVLAIVLIMGVYDFVGGIVAGIILACLNYVVQTSRKSAIRATYSGEIVESTVRRHPIQRHFLHEVGYQIYVTKLAGFLFFGSIVQVEKQSRALIEEEAFRKQPIRYLVFDLDHVTGIDYSAAEAFTRMERVLGRRDVRMIVSGIQMELESGKSLRSVGLWHENSSVEFFENLNTALEYCENELLKAFYQQRDALADPSSDIDLPINKAVPLVKPESSPQLLPTTAITNPLSADPSTGPGLTSYGSPRASALNRAATSTLSSATTPQATDNAKKYAQYKQPLPLILHAFQDLTAQPPDFWAKAVPYFSLLHLPAGAVLYRAGDAPSGFYLLQSGLLRASYDLPVGAYHELIVAGTTCGELPFFSATKRTATVVAERECVAWFLGREEWQRMGREWAEGAREVLEVALRLTKERVDAVTGYVLTTAG